MILKLLRYFSIFLISILLVFSLFHQTLFAKEDRGGIQGNIRFSGQPSKVKNYIVNINQDICGNSVESEDYSLNQENHGVKDIFVSMKNKNEEPSSVQLPEAEILDNIKCRLIPSVLGVRLNQIINIKNSDPVFHSLQFVDKDRLLYNIALPNGGNVVRKKMDQIGMIEVRCTIHPFMQSSIYVSVTPFFSITDKNGIFRMTGLKPGRYQFIANHKSFKRAEKEIDILPGKMINLNIDLEKLEE